MNWDWDKLQEKRQHQQGWNGPRDDRQDDFRDAEDDSRDAQPSDRKGDEPGRRQPGGPGNGGSGNGGGGNDSNGGNGNRGRGIDPLRALRGFRVPGGKWWILAVVVLWLISGIYIVQPDESGVVLRFGRYVRTVEAGPHYHLPYPIEEVFRPKVSQVRQAEVGFRSQSAGGMFQQGRVQAVDEEAAMLTGDENIVNIQFSIQYHIKPDGAVDYLFNVTQPDAVVKKAAEAAMREVIGKTTLDAALTGGRVQVQDDVTQLLQSILDRYQVGVQVVAVQMQDVQPPREVSDAFKDVASAREDKQRLTNEAEAYRRDILPKAQGQAAEIINQAEAYRQTRVRLAEGDALRFLSMLEEYEKSPDITKKRMIYETLEETYGQPGMEKIILPSGVAGNVLPFLPLDGVKAPSANAGGITGAAQTGVPVSDDASALSGQATQPASTVTAAPAASSAINRTSRTARGVN